MAKLKEIAEFLNKELKIDEINDSSYNGLQVEGKEEIKKVGFAVDACLESFESAKKQGCDLLIVHHGLLWDSKKIMIAGILFKRISFLIKNNIALYAAHLPLDCHAKYGNNIQLARLLNLRNVKEFGNYHGFNIGFSGELEKEMSREEFVSFINEKIGANSEVLAFGKEKIRKVGIVSGGGDSSLQEAIDKEIDALLVGDRKYSSIQMAKDGRINLVAAGHYETETWGVKALMPLLKEKFSVETVFIDYNPSQ
ncbi:Nif3-like dinuclear metal center hexameric protein [Candidatus Woesearchaeota archaeon]|nr:MAG: Nif3-like dinuclear metal center hexameric protein [Candidatus Woesearchaeota archaeon]